MAELLSYYITGRKMARKSLKESQGIIKRLLPVWLELKGEGTILEKVTVPEKKHVKKYFTKENISPVVQNYKLSNAESNKLLGNSNIWEKVFEKIICFLQREKFPAININLEGIKANQKEQLNEFAKLAGERFTENQISLELSIPAKIEDNNSSWGGAYDYKKLGRYADKLMIMAYDYHWSGGPPGAISPFFWLRDVIDYSLMSCSPVKIYVGLPCYGYDWEVNNADKKAQGLSFHQVMKLKERYSSRVEWDQESQTPFFKYRKQGQAHEVWFENGKSLQKKIKLIENYELGGIVFWRLGLEDMALWEKIRKREKFKK